jgi:hypothetical protein
MRDMMKEMNINAKDKETEIIKLKNHLGNEKTKVAQMERVQSSYATLSYSTKAY